MSTLQVKTELPFDELLNAVEHITPRSQDGKTELNNLAFACLECNGHKYTKTEGYDFVSGEFVLLLNSASPRPVLSEAEGTITRR